MNTSEPAIRTKVNEVSMLKRALWIGRQQINQGFATPREGAKFKAPGVRLCPVT